jgi:8-oxo-dGTP diphosphatase/2-hydroxy-dATP diphosphatase
MKRKYTLCLVTKDDKVLLGYKKQGFGYGRWNGFGGKVKEGENIAFATKRELTEECGLIARSLVPIGMVNFEFRKNPGNILEVHIFKCNDFSGEVKESAEMRPQWFLPEELPTGEMWDDDKYWLPLFLQGKKFTGYFLFDENDKVIKHELTPVEILEEY